MATIVSWRKLRFIGLISICLLLLYGLHPFINGSGCDFQSQSSDESGVMYVTCNLGLVTILDNRVEGGDIYVYKGVFGRTGETELVFIYDFSVYDRNNEYDYEQILMSSRFRISKRIITNSQDWILVKKPLYRVYSSKRRGRLSWW